MSELKRRLRGDARQEGREQPPRQVQVKFHSRDSRGKGSDGDLAASFAPGFRDGQPEKICFIERSYRGPLPAPGEEWVVTVIHDTKPEDPGKGALIVRPVRRIDATEITLVPDGEPLLGAQLLRAKGMRGLVPVERPNVDPETPEGKKIVEANEQYRDAQNQLKEAVAVNRPRRPDKVFSPIELDCEVLGIVGKIKSTVSIESTGIVEYVVFVSRQPHTYITLEPRILSPLLTSNKNINISSTEHFKDDVVITDYTRALSYFGQPSKQSIEQNTYHQPRLVLSWRMPDDVEITVGMRPDHVIKESLIPCQLQSIEVEKEHIYAQIEFTGYGVCREMVGTLEHFLESNGKIYPLVIHDEKYYELIQQNPEALAMMRALPKKTLPEYQAEYTQAKIAQYISECKKMIDTIEAVSVDAHPTVRTKNSSIQTSSYSEKWDRDFPYSYVATEYLLGIAGKEFNMGYTSQYHKSGDFTGSLPGLPKDFNIRSTITAPLYAQRVVLEAQLQQLSLLIDKMEHVDRITYHSPPDPRYYGNFNTQANTEHSQQLQQKNLAQIESYRKELVQLRDKIKKYLENRKSQEELQCTIPERIDPELETLKRQIADNEGRLNKIDPTILSKYPRVIQEVYQYRRQIEQYFNDITQAAEQIKKQALINPQAANQVLKKWLAELPNSSLSRTLHSLEGSLSFFELLPEYDKVIRAYTEIKPMVEDKIIQNAKLYAFGSRSAAELQGIWRGLQRQIELFSSSGLTRTGIDTAQRILEELRQAAESATAVDTEAIPLSFADELDWLTNVLATIESLSGIQKGTKETAANLNRQVDDLRKSAEKSSTISAAMRSQLYTIRQGVINFFQRPELSKAISEYTGDWLERTRQVWADIPIVIQENPDAQVLINDYHVDSAAILHEVKNTIIQRFPQIMKGQQINREQLNQFVSTVCNNWDLS